MDLLMMSEWGSRCSSVEFDLIDLCNRYVLTCFIVPRGLKTRRH